MFFMKKISAILLSIILIVCLSFSASAAMYTGVDGIAIDIPSNYEFVSLSPDQGTLRSDAEPVIVTAENQINDNEKDNQVS